jgi:hypothetical protein
MKGMKQMSSPLRRLSLALLILAIFVPGASASVVGHLVVGICGGGGVTVDATSIIWAPGGPPAACLELGLGTNITSVGDGNLTGSSPAGTINDLNLLSPGSGAAGFMLFVSPGIDLSFDLAPVGGFGPGSAVSCAVNPGVNNSCSVPGSPFILTQTVSNTGVIGTSVTLDAHGTILDMGDGSTSNWSGSFTTQINDKSPSQIETTIVTGGSIVSSFSGEFDATPMPEPVSMALIGGGLIALAAIRRRKRV